MAPTLRFFGIDVGSKDLVVAENGREGTATFTNTGEGHKKLISYLGSRRATVVMEATGTYGFDIAMKLQARKRIKLLYINPAVAKSFSKVKSLRAKTDQVDAHLLAQLPLALPELAEWQPPRAVCMELRQRTRHIRSMVVDRTRLKNRQHALRATTSSDEFVHSSLERRIAFLDQEIEQTRAEAVKLAQGDEELDRMLQRIVSVRGIAEPSGVEILGELCCLPRDLSPQQLVAHAGLDPRANESGTSKKKRRISRQGNAYLRAAMHMPAINTVKHCPEVREFFDVLHEERHKPKLVAYVAVSRKLLRTLHGLISTNTDFDATRFYQPQKVRTAA